MYTLLMVLTVLLVLLFAGALVYFVAGIHRLLVDIGGTGASFLGKLRVGLRAIETETGHLPTQVNKLNTSLTNIGAGLKAVNTNLEGTIQAALNQKNA